MGLFVLALLAVVPIVAARPPAPTAGTSSWALAFASDALLALLAAGLAVALGLLLGDRANLGLLYDGAAGGGVGAWMRRSLPLATGLGVSFGVLTALSLQALISLSLLPHDLFSEVQRAPWKGLLASLSAGIKEEILLRFGLMTLLAWLVAVIMRRKRAGAASIWLANVVAALLFGVAHIPAASSVTALTATVVVVALAFNGIAGITFGWLYWHHGILAAIASHIAADIVLQVLYPLLAQACGR